MVHNKHLDKPTEERWGPRRAGKLTTIVNGLGNVDLHEEGRFEQMRACRAECHCR